jgi:eukaryotic-like serine/threonine-protein kinase
MSSSPPTTLGKYQIIREIARSNDIVYEAYDPLMHRRVAIKELAMPGGSTSQQREDRIKRFLREARAAGSLTHPNITTVYEMSEEGGRHYIAMEYLDGHTLRNELDTHGSVAPDRAVEIALEILAGLEYAHQHGVVHRDVKPDNIQILSDGRVKLTDFGIARLTFEENLTLDGQVFGTPSYMSPEQVVGREIDARSDLFSLGVVLYEMLGGRKAFTGDSVVSITYSVMNREPDPIPQANFGLWQVLVRALDKSPALRYASAAEMRAALEAALGAMRSGDAVVPSVLPHPYGPQTTQPPHGTYPTGGQPYPGPHPYPVAHPYPGPHPYPVAQPGIYPPGGTQPVPPPPIHAPGVPAPPPYNPYAAPQAPYGAIPPGFPALPIYYPPPPRRPLIRPETKFFVGRLLVALVLLGTMFSLVIVVINAGVQMVGNGRGVFAPAPDEVPGAPVEDRLQRRLSYRAGLTGDAALLEDSRIAALFAELGRKFLRDREYVEAEDSFREAINRNPNDPVLFANLAGLYDRIAAQREADHGRRELYRQSAEAWDQAMRLQAPGELRAGYGRNAAISYFNYAVELSEAGKRREAREQLYKGLQTAPPESGVAREIQQFLRDLS